MCDLSQDLLREHAATAEFDLLVHQVTQDVFTFLTNCRYVLQVDNKFAVAEVCSRLFARSPQLDCLVLGGSSVEKSRLSKQAQQAKEAHEGDRSLRY